MLSESVDEKTFENKRKIFKAGINLNNLKSDLEAAAIFLYLNLLSVRSSGESFKGTLNSYKKKLGVIAPLNERLKDTEICGINALEAISRHMQGRIDDLYWGGMDITTWISPTIRTVLLRES